MYPTPKTQVHILESVDHHCGRRAHDYFLGEILPYIGANAFPKASFHSFEIVSMIHNTSELESRWPVVVLMAAKEMLKFGYKLGQGLGATSCGSPILVELSYNK